MNQDRSQLAVVIAVVLILLLVTTIALLQADFERYLEVIEATPTPSSPGGGRP